MDLFPPSQSSPRNEEDLFPPSQSFPRKYGEGYKGFWCELFPFLNHYAKFTNRDKPLPPWSEDDVQAFIALDPVYGPTLKTGREALKFGLTGSVIGAVQLAHVAWKYSRSLHGAGLSFLAGGVFGWTFGQEVAKHWLQLYRLDTLTAQTKFLEWWQDKNEKRF